MPAQGRARVRLVRNADAAISGGRSETSPTSSKVTRESGITGQNGAAFAIGAGLAGGRAKRGVITA